MMMIGEGNRINPTVSIPPCPWSLFDNNIQSVDMENLMSSSSSPLPVSGVFNGNANGDNGGEYSQFFISEALNALQRYLPCNEVDDDGEYSDGRESDIPIDAYSCDEFRMYEFKVRRCARGRSHDWTECPYAHPGEKARRRDPRKFHYSGTACPDFRKGNCKRGDSCEYAHGVFECWLHPARYRTQPCKDGTSCRRRVCFFAHTPDQLRVLSQQSPRMMADSPPSYDGSPLRHALDSYYAKGSSPNSTLFTPPISPPSDSPPMSPGTQMLSRSVGANPSAMNDMVASLRHLQLNKTKSSPPLRGVQIAPGFGSPSPRAISSLRPVFSSLPNTPTQTVTRSGISKLNFWDSVESLEEEPVMDRVESGKELRSRMYEKLSKENSLDRVDSPAAAPDVGWISELVN